MNTYQDAIRAAVALVATVVALTAGCRKAEPPLPPNHVVVAVAESLPEGPSDAAWDAAPEYVAKLILQDLVDPRLMEPSTAELRVRALSDGSRIAFRLEWDDATANEQLGPAAFADACAVQLPSKIEPTVPDPQMGTPGRPVQISYWSAAWQAIAEGRGDELKDLYPNATIDHYPFDAPSLKPGSPEQQAMQTRYAPARALGNAMPGRDQPVQDLVAEGPGTLAPLPTGTSSGRGERLQNGWAVVISRPLPESQSPELMASVAFAVWEGSHEEAGARKMRTGWIALKGEPSP